MPFFQKKPVVIEARQLTKDNLDEILVWVNSNSKNRVCYRTEQSHAQLPQRPLWMALEGGWPGIQRCISHSLVIPTLEGDHQAAIGDWIIKGVKGEFYPCKPDIFEMTYQPLIKNND
jgi:hypothetical protein